MPDITMCWNHECPLRERCYRYTATPDEHWQSYSDFAPGEDGQCDYFWPTNEAVSGWNRKPFPLKHALACVGPGWKRLVEKCYRALLTEPDPVLLQVKEKYGGLRFYAGSASEATERIIDALMRLRKRALKSASNAVNQASREQIVGGSRRSVMTALREASYE